MASCCDLALCLKDDPLDFGLRVGRDSKGLFTSELEVRAAIAGIWAGPSTSWGSRTWDMILSYDVIGL